MANIKYSHMNGTVGLRPERDNAGRNYVHRPTGIKVGTLLRQLMLAKNLDRDTAAKQIGITRGVLDNCIDNGAITAANVDRIKYWAGRFLKVANAAG